MPKMSVSYIIYPKRSNQKALQCWRVVDRLKHAKAVKECFDIQARGRGHLPGLPNG